jgi:hypothetical protein
MINVVLALIFLDKYLSGKKQPVQESRG